MNEKQKVECDIRKKQMFPISHFQYNYKMWKKYDESRKNANFRLLQNCLLQVSLL